MPDIIATLHPEKDSYTDLYPNIKKENIPIDAIDTYKMKDKSVTLNKLNSDVIDYIDNQGKPTQQQVDSWLDRHPEATTTVEDNSITEIKLSNDLKLKVINPYVTPEMFGAVGDGITDDYQSIQNAYNYAVSNSLPLYFQNTYYMSEGINVLDNQSIKIIGSSHTKWSFNDKKNAIYVDTSFINNTASSPITLQIEMCGLNIVSKNYTSILFNKIILKSSLIHDNTFLNFKHIIFGSISKVSHIQNNIILSCRNTPFYQADDNNVILSDSRIHDNYINCARSSGNSISFMYGDPDGYIYNNYIDFFDFLFKSSRANHYIKNIIFENNIVDQLVCIGELNDELSNTDNYNTTNTILFNCVFSKCMFNGLVDNGLGYTPRLIDIGSINCHNIIFDSCRFMNITNNIVYSNKIKYMSDTTSAYVVRFKNCYTNDFTNINYDNAINIVGFTNQQGKIFIDWDIIDTYSSLPENVSYNGRKIIVNNIMYIAFNNQWHNLY